MKRVNKFLAVLLVSVIYFSALVPGIQVRGAWREPVRAKNAMVASESTLASKIGAEVMRKGGNAVDAAVAVAIAMAVTYPAAGNLGGGGFMLIRTRDEKATAIDYREMAPKAAHRDVYLDKAGNPIEGEGSSTYGYRAAGVPGTTAGMEYAFKKYGSGKLTWAELIEPARQLAANGFAINNDLARAFRGLKDRFAKYEDSRRIFLNNGNYLKEGDLLVQKDLAATLARIQRFGAKGFYEGTTAKLIADDMKANNGLITLEDLKNYKVREREPLRTTYRGHEIIAMPPPSSGGVVMFQTLAMLEKYELRQMEWGSAQRQHLLIEAFRRSYADRAEYMGDPDFTNFPVRQLLDKDYNEKRRLTIDPNKATRSADVKPGEISGTEPTETTHFTVVDKDGTIASNTYTLNGGFGSFVTARGTGVLLNNEMDDFASQPGKPNMFGLVQSERNKIEPGKRPLSSMTPTIVLNKDGSPWFAVGAQGGPIIITAVIQTVINVIDYEMNIQAAMDAPRIHHQWMPDFVIYEPFGMSPETRKSLESMGHIFAPRSGYLASATGIAIEPGTNVRLGATDARGEGEAIGY